MMILVTFYSLTLLQQTLGLGDICKTGEEGESNCIEVNPEDNNQMDLRSWMTEMWKLHWGNDHTNNNYNFAPISTRTCVLDSKPMLCSGGVCDSLKEGVETRETQDGTKYYGHWTPYGVLEGEGNITRSDGTVVKGQFRSGCLTGVVTSLDLDNQLVVTTYHQGTVEQDTPVWLLYPGGEGALYTTFSSGKGMSMFTGDRVVFLYPDYKTAIVGSFLAGSMVETMEGEVKTVSMSGVPRLEVEVKENDALYTRDISTSTHLSSDPLLRDPYEAKMVDVDISTIPGAGMGVFTKRDIPANTIMGYFNGVHKHRADVFSGDKSEYLVEGSHENEMLDIPPDFTSWDSYKASTGHLINHGTEANVEYVDCIHPRFGNILCVKTTKDVAEGSEILVKYDVAVDDGKFKTALRMALELGHLVSGKSRKEFVQGARPYLQLVSDMVKVVKKDFVRF